MRGIILAFALALSLNATPQEQVRVGSLKFTPPKGWKATGDSGPTTAIFAPPDVPAGKSCVIKVFPEEFDKDGFQAWYNRRWNRTVTGGHFVLRMSELEKKKVAGVDLVMRSAAYKKGTGEGYIFVFGLALKDKFFCIWYESDDFDYMEKHQDEVYKVFETLELAEGPPPTTGSSQGTTTTKPPTEKGNETKPPTGEKPSTNLSGQATPNIPNTTWVNDPAGIKRVDRLSEIAHALQDPKTDARQLLTEAVKLCGFAIWTEDQSKIAEPSGSPRLKLAITDTEVKDYAAMFRAGHQVDLSDLIGALDVAYMGAGSKTSCGPNIITWLQQGTSSGNPSIRALISFLQDLDALNPNAVDEDFGGPKTVLDPIQALLILRVVTEEIGEPLRKMIHKQEALEFHASTFPSYLEDEAPGWAEDGFVGSSTGLWENTIEVTESGERTVGRINRTVGHANAVLTLVKFITTYAFLDGKMGVDEGQPLVRTTDQHAGDECTVMAKFFINGTKVTDWMKDHRKLVALAGLDIDMPQSGVLKNVETFWMVNQSIFPTQQLIRGIRNGGGLDRVRTDANGEARVKFEGTPQTHEMDKRRVVPVMKDVKITVTPQVKAAEMQQDLVDAVMGAIGMKALATEGAVGKIAAIANPLMEMLYRAKWKGTVSMRLSVKDWLDYESLGQFTLDVKGTGHEFEQSGVTTWHLNRSLEFIDVGMDILGGQQIPSIDPNLLKNLPESQRKQAEEAMKKASEMAKNKVFSGKEPGKAHIMIRDSKNVSGPGACELEWTRARSTWTGTYGDIFATRAPDGTEMMFRVTVDLDAKTATIIGLAGIKVRYRSRIWGPVPSVTERDEVMGLYGGINMIDPYQNNKPIVIPLREVQGLGAFSYPTYFGEDTIRFRFGPNDKFFGTAKFTYSIAKRIKG